MHSRSGALLTEIKYGLQIRNSTRSYDQLSKSHVQTNGAVKDLPKPQESIAQGGDFLIVAQSDLTNSIALYCEPTSH